jgi:hypothetical protein
MPGTLASLVKARVRIDGLEYHAAATLSDPPANVSESEPKKPEFASKTPVRQ